MKRAYKYRLYPTKEQRILLNKHFGCVRFVYNKALALKNEEYEKGNNISCYDIKKMLPIWKKEYIYLKEVNSLSLQQSILNLDTAFKRYFKKLGGKPKFKSKSNNRYSFTIPQNTVVNFEESKVIIPKFLEGIKCKYHKVFTGEISSSTISKTPDGKYYISILTEEKLEEIKPKEGTIIGIDLGLKEFLITSDNERINNPNFLKTSLPRLKRLQRRLSKTKKSSSNRNKRRYKVALLHKKVSNQRNDFLHKVSKYLTDKYETIVTETLKVKNMIKNSKLSKAISDVAWGKFITFLEYKSKNKEGKIIKIDTFFPSSKTCRHCSNINSELKLSQREWLCPNCNNLIDRDLNASINILNEGKIKILSSTAGTVGIKACGDNVRLEEIPASVFETRSLLYNF